MNENFQQNSEWRRRRQSRYRAMIDNEVYLHGIGEFDNQLESDVVIQEQYDLDADYHQEFDENFYFQDNTDLISHNSSGESNLNTSQSGELTEPTLKNYLEVTMASLFSFCNLNVTEASLVVNTFNCLNKRFSKDPINLPSARYYWRKIAKETTPCVYILCNNHHAHGPFTGEPKDYPQFICENQVYEPELKLGRYFIHVPIREQLIQHLSSISESSWQKVRFNKREITDISNAAQAFNAKSQIPANQNINKYPPTRLTFTLLADEVGVTKESKSKIFPIYIALNELLPPIRRDHFILTGLFVGPTKAMHELYLEPICHDLQDLAQNPVIWTYPESRKSVQATFHLIGLIADSPMRAYLRGVRQYNHTFGCDWCLIQSLSGRPGARVYPPVNKEILQSLKRTRNDFLEFQRNYYSREPINSEKFLGLSRPSPLINLPDFDIVNGVVVEPMHAVILGVFRNIIYKSWLVPGVVFPDRSACLRFESALTQRLSLIKVPSNFARKPRPVEDCRFWKSCEFDALLCYYLLATLKGLLPNKYLLHLMLLSKIYSISHREPVTEQKIEELENLVHIFQRATTVLYSEDFLTYNHHILAHLPDSLRNLGPSGNVSSYPLEDHMGMLQNKVHRYSNVPQALVRVVLNHFKYIECLNKYARNWNLTNREKQNFGINLLKSSSRSDEDVKVSSFNGTKMAYQALSDTAVKLSNITIHKNSPIAASDVKLHSLISYNGLKIASSAYSADKQNDNSAFATKSGNCYKVQFLFSTFSGHFAVAKKFILKPIELKYTQAQDIVSFTVDNIYRIVSIANQREVISLEEISRTLLIIPSSKFENSWKFDQLIDPFLANI